MKRLAVATAADLPASVRRPDSDSSRIGPGILHLGVGAFHRCHQADFTEDALAGSLGNWGIVGVTLRCPTSRRRWPRRTVSTVANCAKAVGRTDA